LVILPDEKPPIRRPECSPPVIVADEGTSTPWQN
jgi:hypothetical protein